MPDETANLFEIMATTRSMRRLKPDPVPAELIRKILEAGVSAPSGGNMQRWRFLVVRDPKVKQTVGAYYKRTWDEVVAPRYRAGEPAPETSPERSRRGEEGSNGACSPSEVCGREPRRRRAAGGTGGGQGGSRCPYR